LSWLGILLLLLFLVSSVGSIVFAFFIIGFLVLGLLVVCLRLCCRLRLCVLLSGCFGLPLLFLLDLIQSCSVLLKLPEKWL
jgi:hypothetical protein